MKKILLSTAVITTFVFYALIRKVTGITSAQDSSQNGFNIPSSSQNNSVVTNYKDGLYTGDLVDAFYGNVQVQVTVSNSKITDVRFLDYPQDRRTSQEINSQAMPLLKSEVIQAQSSNVDIVSGATATSLAFIKSLKSALSQAQG